jgi:dienelactone hydrolase
VSPRGRAGRALLAAGLALALAGCASVARRVDIPRPEEPLDAAPRPAALAGYVTQPDGQGPHPAVVLLHGCSGLPSSRARLEEWAAWYHGRGWVSVVLDSFSPRGVGSVCLRNQVGPYDRAGDAYAALRYLAGLPFVRQDRIVIHGLSHGGWTALRALEDSPFGARPLRFAAGVAYYPVCAGIRRPLYAPAIVLIGERDDWTPAPPCRALHERTRDDPHPLELTVYPGAYHSFDFPGPLRMNEYGKLLGHAPDAARDAERRVDAFLRRLFSAR